MTTNSNSKTITSAINKNLLTPYKRIGLSRNRKRNSSDFKSPVAGGNEKLKEVRLPIDPVVPKVNETHTQEKEIPKNLTSTTSRNKEICNEKKSDDGIKNKKEEKHSTCDQNLKKENSPIKLKVISKDLIPEESRNKRKKAKEKSNLNENLPKDDISETPKKIIKKKKVNVLDSDSEDSVTNNLCNTNIKDDADDIDVFVVNKTESTPKNYSKKKKIHIIHSDSEDSVKSHISTTSTEINKSNEEGVRVVRINSDISIQNDTSNEEVKKEDNEFRIIKKIHRNSSNLQEIKEDEIVNFKHTLNDEKEINSSKNKTKKSIKRKLSLKRDTSKSDEVLSDDEFLSTSEKSKSESNVGSIKLIDDILKLEKVINDKDIEFERLKHVKIYKNLHKIDDLRKETDLWKSGCQEALIDLLLKLQEHATIDMDSLLKNLKMPSNLFRYDNENDCFL